MQRMKYHKLWLDKSFIFAGLSSLIIRGHEGGLFHIE